MRTLTDDIIGVLEAGGLTVADGIAEGLDPPYVVVYPLVQTRDGTWSDAWSDVGKTFQVTCEAVSRQQAEWLADRCDDLIAASDLVAVIAPRAEVVRDDTTGADSRFKAFPRYRIRTFS